MAKIVQRAAVAAAITKVSSGDSSEIATKKRKIVSNTVSSVSANSGAKRLARNSSKKQTTPKVAVSRRSVNVKSSALSAEEGSIVYLGHIPNGFFEKEIRNFFVQFGEVDRVKLFRYYIFIISLQT